MKNMSIKTSILIPTLAVLIFGIVMMVIIVGSVSSSTASELTEDLVFATVNEYSNKFEALCMESYGLSVSLASVLEGIPSSSNNPREEAVSILTSILYANDSIISVWTCWEPNAFDGRDSEYAGTDNNNATGRFTTYVCREGSSYIVGIVEDYDVGDFYQGPRQSGKPYITDPYECEFNGEIIPVYTISIPIIKNGSFAGAVGIDINLDTVDSMIDQGEILDNGYVFLLSPGGFFAAHRDNDLMLQSYDTTWLNDYSSNISSIQENGGSFTARSYSDQLNSDIRLMASGAIIGDTGRYWTVCGVATENDINASSNRLVFAVALIGVILIMVTGLTVLLIVNNRLRKLPAITAEAEAMAKGEIDLADNNTGGEKTKNEIALLERAFASMAKGIRRQSDTVMRIAEGDYSVTIPVRSDADVMNKAINNMIDSTNEVMNEIRMSSMQVSAGSKHISDGAQALAQGATEQAAAIEELSASMSEISDITSQNANIAREAADLSGVIRSNAEKGSGQMEHMMQAVMEINEASGQIGKVIKVIEDIAFQTNVLALNASVEAARAGQHGKGFAVVAEEVGNLAAESSEAAKDTGALIENSIEKANLGLNIATETSESLEEMVSGVNQSAQIVERIAQSCDEQSAAIRQINTGVDQVAQVIQQNSATAEESAAASEEMSGQSNMLKQMIARFKLKNTDYSSSLDDDSI